MAGKKQVATIASNGKVRFLGEKYVARRRKYGLYRRIGRATNLQFANAHNYLKHNADIIYVPKWHIAGTEKEIKEFLKMQGISAAEIKEALGEHYGHKHLEHARFKEAHGAAKALKKAYREYMNQLRETRATRKRKVGSAGRSSSPVKVTLEVAAPKATSPKKGKGKGAKKGKAAATEVKLDVVVSKAASPKKHKGAKKSAAAGVAGLPSLVPLMAF